MVVELISFFATSFLSDQAAGLVKKIFNATIQKTIDKDLHKNPKRLKNLLLNELEKNPNLVSNLENMIEQNEIIKHELKTLQKEENRLLHDKKNNI